MQGLPSDFSSVADRAWEHVQRAPGFLTEKEARFLLLAAARTPATGVILEIGSFKGRSTVGLATVAARYGLGPLVAVDPHTAPSSTDPDLEGKPSSYEEFLESLRRAAVEDVVEVHRAYSRELAAGWHRPIRLLWIDGDHTLQGAREDFQLFRPYLTEGAVVAMHDVLNAFEGPIRVFVEEILESDDFGPVGLCGSIGWGQFRPPQGVGWRARGKRRRLARRVARLVPDAARRHELRGYPRLRYRLFRALVPNGPVDPARWSRIVGEGPRGPAAGSDSESRPRE